MTLSGEISGRALVFGDDISTDVLAPGRYMKLSEKELAAHCLEAIDPEFARRVQKNDILVAGRNFGIGSSREQAATSLKVLGIGAILAQSFARIFFRNAINIGLLAVAFPEAGEISDLDRLRVYATNGSIDNLTTGKNYRVEPLPDHLAAIIRDGGLIAHLKTRLGNRQPAASDT